MTGLALAFFVVGLGFGTTVRFPTFALFTLAALAAFAVLNATAVSIAGLLYRLALIASALQLGYFATIATRILLERRRRNSGK